MSKKTPNTGKNQTAFTSIQGDFFLDLETPSNERGFDNADMDIRFELRAAMSQATKIARTSYGMRVPEIVNEMNRLLPELDKKITKRQLYAWMAASAEDKEFPTRYLPAFCAATRCNLPIRVMANTLYLDLLDQRDRIAAELGDIEIKQAQLTRKKKQLKTTYGDNYDNKNY